MARENKSRYVLLGFLLKQPQSGYDLKKAVEAGPGHFWHEGFGQIYPMLKRMAAEGLVTSKREAQQSRPDRIEYTITEAGRKAFADWADKPFDPCSIRDELLLKLFFGRHVPAETSRRHVRQGLAHHQATLRVLDDIEAMIKEKAWEHPDRPYWIITLSFGQSHNRSAMEWCRKTLDEMGEDTPD